VTSSDKKLYPSSEGNAWINEEIKEPKMVFIMSP